MTCVKLAITIKTKIKIKIFPQQQLGENKLANIGAGCRLKFERQDDQLFARARILLVPALISADCFYFHLYC